ncbi:conserved Plasmodium protein, unknown function [Plasmodium sp. DRC-Itaito]|nr:conserved Plasmodium protein, unknown function [Plasmodium sp. DRC-Itaito]
MLKYINQSKVLLLRKMSTVNKNMSKINQLNKDIFIGLKEKTSILKKEKLYLEPVEEKLHLTNLETCCPLTHFILAYKIKIDTSGVQLKVANNSGGTKRKNEEKNDQKNEANVNDQKNEANVNDKKNEANVNDQKNETNVNDKKNEANDQKNETNVNDQKNEANDQKNETNVNDENNKVDFYDSFVQLNIPVLKNFEKDYFFKHIIELIDSLAADVVYRHSIGVYKRNEKFNFVTVLFNNLKTYEKKLLHHDFSFGLCDTYPLTINCYIVNSGTTSYILKVDFFQQNNLVFDIYTTFVNVNCLTFKPQQVVPVLNSLKDEKYEKIKTLCSHIKDVQSLFNYKDIKSKTLHQNDYDILSNYFKEYETQKLGYIKNINEYTNLYDNEENEIAQNSNQNILTIFDSILNSNDFSFYAGKEQYACKDTYVQSHNFISSEFKNIHNFTFGGHLAYLSFCHAMVVIKKFVTKPILKEINSIQYILPVPVNTEVLYKGKVVYSDQNKIQVNVATYCFDYKKKNYYLTTICDMSFENNSDISFVPKSQEEFKLYMLSYLRSQILS